MKLLSDPVYIMAVLLLLIVLSEWIGGKRYFRHIGAGLLVIILAAILANLRVIPSSQNVPSVYNHIFTYVAPIAIFFLLLDVKLKNLRYAGIPMMSMFLIGSLCTMSGAIIGYFIVSPQHHHIDSAFAVAGMYTGTYIGGSANLNAIAIHYGVVKDGNLFAAINVVDNIITTVWIMATLVLPSVLQKFFPRKKNVPPQEASSTNEELFQKIMSKKETINVLNISILLLLAVASLFLSGLVNFYFPKIPSIIVLTTVALVLAQLPAIQEIQGAKTLGYFSVLLFLAVIGAYCDLGALKQSGSIAGILLLWVVIIVLIHGVILFAIGGIFKQDWDIVSIASNANIGGTATAAVCANSLGRHDLQLAGILAGAVGNAIGTYAGIFVAELLK
jgi:uncharacterized membrane protein